MAEQNRVIGRDAEGREEGALGFLEVAQLDQVERENVLQLHVLGVELKAAACGIGAFVVAIELVQGLPAERPGLGLLEDLGAVECLEDAPRLTDRREVARQLELPAGDLAHETATAAAIPATKPQAIVVTIPRSQSEPYASRFRPAA